MGFFGKLFEKKQCDLCGGEIGLLGNRKLEDGNCCKDCVKKLSPWFEERRHSTVAQIQEQLAYRAENEKKLADFRVAKVIGDYYKMYVEEVNGIPTRFFVSCDDDYMSDNPDIIEFKDLMSCSIDEDSHETELERDDGNGNKVSYNPPRYETDYNFYVEMQIANNPYFDHIRFRINDSTVTLETRGGSSVSFLGMNFNSGAVNVGSPREQQRYEAYTAMCREIEETVQRSRNTTPQEAPAAEPVVEQVPAGPKFCPNCGAPAEGGKFCQSCGSQL